MSTGKVEQQSTNGDKTPAAPPEKPKPAARDRVSGLVAVPAPAPAQLPDAVTENVQVANSEEQQKAEAEALAGADPKNDYATLISSVVYDNPFKVEPQMLSFMVDPNDGDECKRFVTVTNNTPERAAFKVKTNKPKRYLVKPSITFVAANSQEVIEITLREKEVEPIATKMRGDGLQKEMQTDKFLIQWMNIDKKFYIDEAFFHLVKKESWIDKAQKLIKSVPKSEQKQRFKFARLKVQYQLPAKPSATELSTTVEGDEEETE